MTAGAILRVLAAVALAGLLAPSAVPAQERETGEREWAPGLVLDEGGGWRVPTAVEALRALRGDWSLLDDPDPDNSPAVALLREEHGPRTQAEQEALVDALVDLLLIGPGTRPTSTWSDPRPTPRCRRRSATHPT